MILADIAKARTLALASGFFLEIGPRGLIHDLNPGSGLMAVVRRTPQKRSVCAVKANGKTKVNPCLTDGGTARALH